MNTDDPLGNKSPGKSSNTGNEPEADEDLPLRRRQLIELVERRAEHELDDDDWWDDMVARGEQNIRDWQSECEVQAFNDLMGLLCGGTGTIDGLYRDDTLEKQYKTDAEALWLLYGVMRYTGESPEHAGKLAYIILYHYCEETDTTRRFYAHPERYRQDQLLEAMENFDRGRWLHWHRRSHANGRDEDDWETWTDDYGKVGYDLMLATIDIACGVTDPEVASQIYDLDLPETSKIIDILSTIDGLQFHKIPPGGPTPVGLASSGDSGECQYPTTAAAQEAARAIDEATGGDPLDYDSYKSIRQRLQRRGLLKMACLKEGVDYRVYPSHLPDPPEACNVIFGGDDDVPEDDPDSIEEESDQTVMTDGGTRSDDTEDDVDKPSHTTEDLDGLGRRSPAVFACPIKGCSRIVIDNPGDLRNHVAQESDDAHRYRTLNEDLEVVTQWEAMDWGWGPPE